MLDPTAVLLILLVFSLQAVGRPPEPLEHALDEVQQCHLPCSMLFYGREVGCGYDVVLSGVRSRRKAWRCSSDVKFCPSRP
jgi:hypothetical protein